jgi:predicted RNase H-like nuclease (RuvC/YqgF family)
VAEIYPGLVAHSADGKIETVMYQHLPPMLLNEVQKQHRAIGELQAQLQSKDREIDALKRDLAGIKQKLGLD